MIAEIHNKISRSGSNLSDRLEDQLTGDFFGAIRYLPFQYGLKPVLEAVHFHDTARDSASCWEKLLDSIREYDYKVEFWFRHEEGEIDLIVEHPDVVIGIEVKYYSGLSSDAEDPEEMVTPEESCHQLARYSRLLEDIRNGRPAYLIFLAPFDIQFSVEMNMRERSLISPGITLGFLAWEQVLEQLQSIEISSLDIGQQIIIRDLTNLLLRKGFERFKGFLSGIQHISIHENAYSFKGKSHAQLTINWPENVSVQEGNYVFNK